MHLAKYLRLFSLGFFVLLFFCLLLVFGFGLLLLVLVVVFCLFLLFVLFFVRGDVLVCLLHRDFVLRCVLACLLPLGWCFIRLWSYPVLKIDSGCLFLSAGAYFCLFLFWCLFFCLFLLVAGAGAGVFCC